ncbi:MAG: YceI family protein [Chloroflexota bacterium]
MKSTWTLDTAHTQADFAAKHLMISTVRGHFAGIAGTIELDEDDLTNSTVVVAIDATTVDTGMAQRDGHLRGTDFFDVETYPTISFRSTKVEKAGAEYRIAGDLTIKDVTRPVVLDAEFLGIVPSMQGGRHAGFTATTKIDREDWGLKWNVGLESGGWLVGKEITLTIDAAADAAVESIVATA